MTHVVGIVPVDRRMEQTDVRDQGDRPTCAAFAVTAGHEWLRRDTTDLSEEFAHWAAKSRDGIAGEATTVTAVIEGMLAEGQALEVDWPYGKPSYPAAPPLAALNAARAQLPRSFSRLSPSLADLRNTIVLGRQAVCLRMAFIPHAWAKAVGGWIDAGGPQQPIGNHAVLAVGVRVAESKRPWSIIVKNSWGRHWGDGGYGYVSAEYLQSHDWSAYGIEGQ